MPAIPAWPPKSPPRLFVREPPSEGTPIEIGPRQANYLGTVLRMGVGAEWRWPVTGAKRRAP